jgi:hypothetical protein
MKRSALALLLALAALALACGTLPPYETPEERGGSLPLARSEQQRTGELTWRPGRLQQTPEGVRFEFTLVNGTARDYFSVMLRLVLRGSEHRIATVRYPAGAVAAGGSRRVRAHLAPPGFAVEGADLELIFAQE